MKLKSILTLLSFLFTISASAQWVQVGSDIDGPSSQDWSGSSVSVSSDGNTVAIGTPRYGSSGQVAVYELIGSDWVLKGSSINGTGSGSRSGYSVSISSDGNTVAIGAPHYFYEPGYSKIYEWNGNLWIQKGSTIHGDNDDDRSGASVSLSSDGNTVAIGAPDDVDGYGPNVSLVRIHEWTGTEWMQKGDDFDGLGSNEHTGTSVSMSTDGNVVAISSPNQSQNGTGIGRVCVYEWSDTTWVQKGEDINGTYPNQFGLSISMSSDGNIVAIGAPSQPFYNSSHPSQVGVYEWSGTEWLQIGENIESEEEGDWNGWSVSLSSDGNTLAVGAPENNGTGLNAGHVRVFHRNGSEWLQNGADIDGESAGDWSGYAVSLSSNGNRVAIGARRNDGNNGSLEYSGHVRVYHNDSNVDVDEGQLIKEMVVYPNPTNGYFSIDLGENQKPSTITITDLRGKVVHSSTTNATPFLNLKLETSPGLYFVKVNSGTDQTTLRLIVE